MTTFAARRHHEPRVGPIGLEIGDQEAAGLARPGAGAGEHVDEEAEMWIAFVSGVDDRQHDGVG